MTIPVLAALCADSIAHPERSFPEEPFIALVSKGRNCLPKKFWPREKLFHPLCEKTPGETLYIYDATKVLTALARLLEKIKEAGDGTRL